MLQEPGRDQKDPVVVTETNKLITFHCFTGNEETAVERNSYVISAIIISLLLTASFAVLSSNPNDISASVGSGGTGVPDTEWYDDVSLSFTINNADELAGLAQIVNGTAPGITKDSFLNKTVTIGDDIDLSLYGPTFNGGKGWVHIGDQFADSFKGTFDGNGKIISGLYVNAVSGEDSYYVGLFGVVHQGAVKNVAVVGADITGKEYVGGIAGSVGMGASIANCYSSGTVAGDKYVGGITGISGYNGTVTDCFSSCNVSGNKFVGGITGYEESRGVTSRCYSTGSVSGTDSVGGIVGLVDGTVTDCAALNPSVSGEQNVGRVAGRVGTGSSENSIALSSMDAPKSGGGDNGTSVSLSRIASDGTLGGRFTEENGWTTENGKLPGLFGNAEEFPDHMATAQTPAAAPPTTQVIIFVAVAITALILVVLASFALRRPGRKG